MINANEVRIGNKVNFGLVPVTIKGIHTQTVGETDKRTVHYYVSDFVEFSRYYAVEAYNLEPIPLTHEILEKCGFDMFPDWTITKKDGSAAFLDLGWLNISMSAMGGVGLFDNDGISTGVNIQYIHQLQNLFWCLTGTELEINF